MRCQARRQGGMYRSLAPMALLSLACALPQAGEVDRAPVPGVGKFGSPLPGGDGGGSAAPRAGKRETLSEVHVEERFCMSNNRRRSSWICWARVDLRECLCMALFVLLTSSLGDGVFPSQGEALGLAVRGTSGRPSRGGLRACAGRPRERSWEAGRLLLLSRMRDQSPLPADPPLTSPCMLSAPRRSSSS
ncbi:unnamed protein product [Prorocentrum cordatum]|uniref:Uncharacterized protein n=1 Tax=Prorocentrum cordatum TaxID=2364126 RepID=A0ABN9VD26_9DINO|nr:unnamed protein product [Polarella glacialis]